MGTVDFHKYHYLVVDDDTFTCQLIIKMLQKFGASAIDSAADGALAVTSISAEGGLPDVIICDLNMPRLDGVEFMRVLAERQFAGGLIMVSSSDKKVLKTVTDLAHAYHLNVLGALPKPITPAAFSQMLARFEGTQKEPKVIAPPKMVSPEELSEALDKDQLVPFFQPQISVATGEVAGVEALVRWRHPERGWILPGLFIPVAEEHGLIDRLTWDVFSKAARQVAAWRQNGIEMSLAVNVSVLSLSDTNLPDRLVNELQAVNLPTPALILEVTESCLMDNMTPALDTLVRLRLKGIGLSIDDFGTGHSTLEQLHKIPFAELKVDRLFVNGCSYNAEAKLCFESAVGLARKLELNVVAEGVENVADWNVCAELECDVVQGFFIARPMPAEEFLDWHERWQSSTRKDYALSRQ